MLWFHAFVSLGVIIHPCSLLCREATHATPKACYPRRCRCPLCGRAVKCKLLGKTAFGWYHLARQLSVSAAHIVARCLVAVSGVVIHAPPNALPLSALLFLLTSLVISSPPICAFLPPHPYCLSSLSLPPYTPITPLHVRSLSAFSVLFCPLSPVPPLPFILFPRPFSPFSVFSRPSGSPFPLLVPAVNLVS